MLLRWENGRITIVPGNDPFQGTGLDGNVYQTATVFTQKPDTSHLLAVPFDARTRSVQGRGWHCIEFNHNQIGNSNRFYSYISDRGARLKIAAPMAPHWQPELLDPYYACEDRHRTRIQAGLIGELSLLFALAAFSAPPTSQGSLLNSIVPRRWIPHGQSTGRTSPESVQLRRPCLRDLDIQHRGMVVTVYTDPRNTTGSTPQILTRLQNGEYGPFYGPQ